MIKKKLVICLNYGHFEKKMRSVIICQITISTKSLMSIPLRIFAICRSLKSICHTLSAGSVRMLYMLDKNILLMIGDSSTSL